MAMDEEEEILLEEELQGNPEGIL
jgi:hypothetical protein